MGGRHWAVEALISMILILWVLSLVWGIYKRICFIEEEMIICIGLEIFRNTSSFFEHCSKNLPGIRSLFRICEATVTKRAWTLSIPQNLRLAQQRYKQSLLLELRLVCALLWIYFDREFYQRKSAPVLACDSGLMVFIMFVCIMFILTNHCMLSSRNYLCCPKEFLFYFSHILQIGERVNSV